MVYQEAKTYREHGVNEYPPGDMCLPFSTGLLLSAFVFSLHTSNIRGGATKLGFVSSACLVLSAAHLLIFDSSVEVSVRRLHACSASGATHSCKEWYNSRPVCHYSLVIVSSMKHLCSPISPHLHRQLLFFARRSHRRGCFPVLSDSQRCRSFRIPEFHAHTFPFYFYFFKKTQLFMPSDEDPLGRRRSSRRTTKCALVSPCGERFSAWRSGAITRFRHRNACSS